MAFHGMEWRSPPNNVLLLFATTAFHGMAFSSSSTSGGGDEIAVFVDTNMGTRIAMAVSPPDINVADFKREFERTHFSCFPKLGEIKVCELMIKRRSCFYHLPGSLPLQYAFQGLKGTRFLHVKIRPPIAHASDPINATGSLALNNEVDTDDDRKTAKGLLSTKLSAAELPKPIPCFESGESNKGLNDIVDCIAKDMNKEFHNRNEETPPIPGKEIFCLRNEVKPGITTSAPTVKDPNESSLEPESVGGGINIQGNHLISKFVSTCCNRQMSKVASIASENDLEKSPKARKDGRSPNMVFGNMQEFCIRTPPKTSSYPYHARPDHVSSSIERERDVTVGRRLLTAAKHLGVYGKQTTAISFSRFRGKLISLSAHRYSVFQMSDNDD